MGYLYRDGSVFSSARNKDGKPITDVEVQLSTVQDVFTGSSNVTKTYETEMDTFTITNKGTSDLTFTINGITVPVYSGEKYEDHFAPFTKVIITATGAFRAQVKGKGVFSPPADTTAPNNVPTPINVSNLTGTSLTLSWTASSSSDVAGYDVYKGSTLLGSVTGTTYNVTGLSPSTLYTFTIKAKDGSGNIASGTQVQATTTAGADTTAPVAPTSLTVGTVTSSSIAVSWPLSSSNDVANYEIAYSSNGGNTYTVASNVINASSTSYTINGLNASTAYIVRLVAIDGAGNRSNPITANATTATPADTTPPNNVPSPINVTNLASSSLTLSWSASSSPDVASYDVYNGSTLLGNTALLTFNVTGLSPLTSYTFLVKAKDSSGNAASGTSVNATTSSSTVTGVTLDKTTASIEQQTTLQLNATVTPSDAANKNVTWSSSNTSVATVDSNGLVSGVTAGTAVITATTVDGGKTATCNLTVTQIIVGFDYNNLTVDPDGSTVTFDQVVNGQNDWVHPSVLYFANGWNGHKYWGGFSPYPDTQGSWENTYFFYSDDGDSWHTPAGVTGTIFPLQGGFNNNSDPNLFMDYDGVTMHILNRAVYLTTPAGMTTSTGSIIEIISTTDGVTFTQRKTIIDTATLGYDIVAPSVVKYNNKYYMFAQRTDNLSVVAVFEATDPNGTWTKINDMSTGTLGQLWHCEVRYLNQEFILIGSSGAQQGGNLMLGKFQTPMDTTVVGRNNFFIVAPNLSGKPWTASIYKSSLVVKNDTDIEVFVGWKGAKLDSTTDWRVGRYPVQRLTQTLDLSGYTEYTAGAKASLTDATTASSDYYKYVFDATFDSITTKAVAYRTGTSEFASMYIENSVLYIELWKSGSLRKVPISYGISQGDRITFTYDTDMVFYINGRKVYTVSNASDQYGPLLLTGGGGSYGVTAGSVSNVKIYKKPVYTYDTSSAVTAKDNAKTDTANLIIADEFNRSDVAIGLSDNNLDYAVDGKIIGSPSPNGSKVTLSTSDTNALLVPVEGNYQVFIGTDSGSNYLFGLYLAYDDSNNYVKFQTDDSTVFRIRKRVSGANTDTSYSGLGNGRSHSNYRFDVIDGVIYIYTDNVYIGKMTIPSNTNAKYVGVTGFYAATAVDYFVVKQLSSTVPVVRMTSSRKFVGNQTVTLSASGTGTKIYYTTDDSTPSTGSTLYTAPFTISATTTVKAIAVSADGSQTSPVKATTYTLTVPTVVVSDDFNRADTTADTTGAGMGTTPVGSQAWSQVVTTAGTIQVLGNLAKTPVSGDFVVESGYGDNFTAEITLASGSNQSGLIFNYLDNSNYMAIKRWTSTIDFVWNGSVNKSFSTATAAAGDKLKIVRSGPKLTFYVNDVQVGFLENSSFPKGTKHGILGYTNATFDNLKVTANI